MESIIFQRVLTRLRGVSPHELTALATSTGYTRRHLQKVRDGEIPRPGVEVIDALAPHLGLRVQVGAYVIERLKAADAADLTAAAAAAGVDADYLRRIRDGRIKSPNIVLCEALYAHFRRIARRRVP